MLSRKLFWIVTAAVVAVAMVAGLQLGGLHDDPERLLTHAAWVEVFDSPGKLALGVDAVVVATAIDVAPGRIAFSENGEDSLPFEVWHFEVAKGISGAYEGEVVSVERTGGLDHQGHKVYIDADGGAFELGQQYLLFLRRQEDGPYYYQVNHQGRYRVAGERLQAAAPHDRVAATFHGRPLAEGLAAVKASLASRSDLER
jgi:hypothetical protein